MSNDERRILIAGGGPVGLLCAWLLGRRCLAVRLFDNNSALQADPRAATTHPATLDLLDDELVGDMARVGLVAPIFQFWDRPSQALVAQFDHVQEQSIANKKRLEARECASAISTSCARVRPTPNAPGSFSFALR
jgi:2-polyprenyl-6-methoxyphenol hydroxylase-like FAD-dependent oxidoreductase